MVFLGQYQDHKVDHLSSVEASIPKVIRVLVCDVLTDVIALSEQDRLYLKCLRQGTGRFVIKSNKTNTVDWHENEKNEEWRCHVLLCHLSDNEESLEVFQENSSEHWLVPVVIVITGYSVVTDKTVQGLLHVAVT